MERTLLLEFVRVTEAGALAASRLMGRDDGTGADQAAVEAMRRAMDEVHMDGTIVIGEGERDEAPCCTSARRWGAGVPPTTRPLARAMDTRVIGEVSTSLPPRLQWTSPSIRWRARTWWPAARQGPSRCWRWPSGGLLHAPDIYMEKLCVGPTAAGKVRMDFPIAANLRIIADSLRRRVEDITVVILSRERHQPLIEEVRQAGARIRLIGDGDVLAAISAAISGTGDHCVMGSGGPRKGCSRPPPCAAWGPDPGAVRPPQRRRARTLPGDGGRSGAGL